MPRAGGDGMILVTGATGYVGGRLLARFEREGRAVRAMARRPEHLQGRVQPSTDVVAADVLDRASLDAAMTGVDVAYYLVHSMAGPGKFEEADRAGARNFGAAAKAAGVRRVIYLGGLAGDPAGLSAHLRSRQEVGELLRASGVPVIELRASVIIGSGSLSFELIRALVERLPVMITPRWVGTPAQPIAIEDVVAYLAEAASLAGEGSRTFEIGGADVVSYAGLMRAYARRRGLRARMLPVPVLTPRLSSLWLGLVTPVYARVGRQLIDSMRHPSVVSDPSALAAFTVRPMGVEQAVSRALAREDAEFALTRWSDALSAAGEPRAWGGVTFGTRLVDSRTIRVARPPAAAFAPIQRIGGDHGWYAMNALWRLRGYLDLLAGGVGMRRGRPFPYLLRVGDPIDFWRVEAFEPDRRLRLAAEMRLPGRAWLEFEVTGDAASSVIRQTAIFDPRGLAGQAYWYAMYPLHQIVFDGMLRRLAYAAGRESPGPSAP